MRIVSWNVNGLRACHQKGFLTWLGKAGAEVVGLQEVRARPEQLPEELRAPAGWHTHFSPAERPGYSGVGLYARTAPDGVETTLGVPEFDAEGRVQLARFGELLVVNGYFPNGNGKARDNSRIPFKLDFYRRLFELLEPHRRAGAPVLVMGDLNTAHTELDLARPKDNQETSGFRPEERAELARWVESGWVDTFRHYEKGGGHYSWWSQRFGVRARNVGWRIDYVLASPGAMPFLRAAAIHPEVQGSDHCPVSVVVDPAITGPARARRSPARLPPPAEAPAGVPATNAVRAGRKDTLRTGTREAVRAATKNTVREGTKSAVRTRPAAGKVLASPARPARSRGARTGRS